MLRKVPFCIALAAIVLALLAEVGTTLVVSRDRPQPHEQTRALEQIGVAHRDAARVQTSARPPDGLAMPALTQLDALLVLTLLLMGGSLLIHGRIWGRMQAFVRLLASLLVLLLAVVMLIKAFALLMLMVSLFLAVPFGTIAYVAMWGFFDADAVDALLSVSLLLKIVCCVALVIAHPRFLAAKTLVFLTLFSLVSNVIASFVFGILPSVVASIADAALAILFAIFTIVWALVILLGSVLPAIRSLRLGSESA